MTDTPTSRAMPEGPATPRPGRRARRGASRGARARARTTTLLLTAAVAIGALALLVPTTPLLGLLLIAAILAGVVATLVRHARREHDEHVTLDDLAAAGYTVLHDRVAPGYAGTVRRLIIGPAGVFLVEVNDDAGRVRVRGTGVYVGGRSMALGPRLQGQLRAVSAALAPQLTAAGARVTPLICMRRAELPLFRRHVAGIPLLREPGLVRRIVEAPSVMDEATASWIADLARSTMPAVGRAAQADADDDQGAGRPRRTGPIRARQTPAGEATPADALSEAPSPA
jgi:hypothetical protein